MAREKRWHILPCDCDAADRLARQLGLMRITAQVLMHHGVADADAARAFLNPSLNGLHDPFLLPGLDRAAERVRLAVERKEPIVIYGDYDVDGISATAILMRCLTFMGAPPQFYLPDRIKEGYGLNAEAVRKIAEGGARLLITVDCGIGAVAEVALARELGLDVIITDHHEPGDEVPADALLIDPKLPGSPYPFRELSGAGLAFKLAWAVCKSFSSGHRVKPEFREFLLDSMSLAALGTIADVVPLRDENRVLAHFGLRGLAASNAPGIKALREAAGVDERRLTAFDVAYRLAPRLNAAGRLGSASDALKLLAAESLPSASDTAANLNRENARRQRIQERILNEARKMIAAGDVSARFSIVLASKNWHAGVIGIVAARLVGEHFRPTVLVALDGDNGDGSARSIAPLHLFETLQACSDRLISFGGHAQAAGLRIRKAEVASFAEAFEAAVAARLTAEDLIPVLDIICEVRLEDLTRPLLDEIATLGPFGEGNDEPVLASVNLALPSGARRMGSDGRHLQFWVKQDGAAFRAVAFGMGEMADALNRSNLCSLAFVPRINRWRGTESVELEVRDIKIDVHGQPRTR